MIKSVLCIFAIITFLLAKRLLFACHINCVLIVIYILPVKYIKVINLIQNTKGKYTLLLHIEVTF